MTDDTDPKTNLLTTLFSSGGDQTVKIITLALVAITGGGNFLMTRQTGKETDHDVRQALREVHAMHNVLDATVQRQKDIYEMLQKLTKEKKTNGS